MMILRIILNPSFLHYTVSYCPMWKFLPQLDVLWLVYQYFVFVCQSTVWSHGKLLFWQKYLILLIQRALFLTVPALPAVYGHVLTYIKRILSSDPINKPLAQLKSILDPSLGYLCTRTNKAMFTFVCLQDISLDPVIVKHNWLEKLLQRILHE